MSIPLYFVADRKESVSYPQGRAIPYGCGITKNGEFRQPENFWSNGPLLLDDANPINPTEKCLNKIEALCQQGCILDFERPTNNFHITLIYQLKKRNISPIWLPQRFADYAPKEIIIFTLSLQHNSWIQYCKSLQLQYPNRWALELQPNHLKKNLPTAQNDRTFFLNDAACMCNIQNGTVTYYDTQQTLLKKMKIAETFGCYGGIALWSEWNRQR